jgi:hypothetical protein
MVVACFRWVIAVTVLSTVGFCQTPGQVAAAAKSLDDYRHSKATILRDDFGEMGVTGRRMRRWQHLQWGRSG